MLIKENVLPVSLRRLLNILLMLTIPLVMFLGAQIKIYLPYTPVPVTLQTFFLFIMAAYLPWGISTTGQGLYLAGGLLGLPFFANGLMGIQALLHPTSGYIIGFILATGFIGYFISKIKRYSFLKISLLLAAGSLIYFTCGVLRLSLLFGLGKAVLLGFFPFAFGDLIKIVFSTFIILKLKKERL